MKILLIDDVVANLRFMDRLLSRQGFQVVTESNPCIALDIIAEDPSFRAVVVDYMMPEMNGMEFFEKYRALPRFCNVSSMQIPPCILITAWSSDFSSGDALQLGFHKVMKKPFPNEALLECLGEIRDGALIRNRNILCVNAAPARKEALQKLALRIHCQFRFSDDYSRAFSILNADNRIGNVICYSESSIEDCGDFANQVTGICRHNDQGHTIRPGFIMIHSGPVPKTVESFWDRLITEPNDYLVLAQTILELGKSSHTHQATAHEKMVLVVSDIGINTTFLEHLLGKWGISLLTIESEEEALHILNSDMNINIDLVLMPAQTHTVSGGEFLQSYLATRKRDTLMAGKTIPFIMISDNRNEMIHCGDYPSVSVEVFHKPLNISLFRKTMESLLKIGPQADFGSQRH